MTRMQSQVGWFYAIQPLPDIYPKRIKFGWSMDVDTRMLSYKTICPEVMLVRKWRCHRSFEKSAVKFAQRWGKPVGKELVDVENVSKTIGEIGVYIVSHMSTLKWNSAVVLHELENSL